MVDTKVEFNRDSFSPVWDYFYEFEKRFNLICLELEDSFGLLKLPVPLSEVSL